MRHVAYLRVSSAERQGKNETIHNQKNETIRYCERLGVDLLDWYEDNDVSGQIPMGKRPAGRRLLEDAKAARFDTLLVYKIDRLGRNTIDSLTVAKDLNRMGIRILSMTEPFDTSGPMGEFVFTVFAGVAQMERTNILDRTMLGRLEAVRDNRWVGGRLPYGYLVQDKRLVPHPQQAPTVRRVFRLYADGFDTSAICRILNGEGIPSQLGGEWETRSINRILQNRLYVGTGTYRKWRQVREDGHYVCYELQPEENHIQYDVPAIVDAELFEKCQATRKRRPRTGRRPDKYPFLLSGLIKCMCGSPVHGNCVNKAGKLYPYYRCPACRVNRQAVPIDAEVWDDIRTLAHYPEETISSLRTSQASREDELHDAQKRLAGKEEERTRVRTGWRKGLITDAELEEDLASIRREEAELQQEVENLISYETQRRNSALNCQDAIDALKLILTENFDTTHAERKRQVVKSLVEEVLFLHEGERITYRLGTEANVLTLVRLHKPLMAPKLQECEV
jgi:site-specific DNA recombinase